MSTNDGKRWVHGAGYVEAQPFTEERRQELYKEVGRIERLCMGLDCDEGDACITVPNEYIDWEKVLESLSSVRYMVAAIETDTERQERARRDVQETASSIFTFANKAVTQLPS